MLTSLYRLLSISVLLLAAFVAGGERACAQATNFAYAPQSALAEGRWVKVKVRTTGVHAITDSELRAMGFDDPSRVTVHGFPAVVLSNYRLTSASPDDLPQVPTLRRGNRLLFYAVGDVDFNLYTTRSGGTVLYPVNLTRNYFARCSEYFLTDSRKPLAHTQVSFDGDVTFYHNSCRSVVHIEDEVQNTHQLGARFFGPDFGSQPAQSYSFAMPGYKPGGEVVVQGVLAVSSQIDGSFSFPVTLPSGSQAQIKIPRHPESDYHYYGTRFTTYDRPPLSPTGQYSVSLNAEPYQITYGGVDYLTLTYPRTTEFTAADQELMLFTALYADDGVEISLPAGSAQPMVWDVTEPAAPKLLHTWAPSEATVCVTPGAVANVGGGIKERRLAVFNPDGDLLRVESPQPVAPSNLHAMPTPRLLIVAASRWLPEAERLAEAHRRTQGIDVAVVVQEDIYNEFSSGVPHVMGLRRFVRMLHDRNPEKLRSVLLFGAATYDNRNILGLDEAEFRSTHIPIFQCEDISISGRKPKSYATDAIVGMLADTPEEFTLVDAEMTVNVSRIPVRRPQEATAVVNKIVAYLENPPVADRHARALLMSDKGDCNSHLSDSELIASTIAKTDSTVTITRAYNSLFPIVQGKAAELNRQITSTLSRGVSYWGYTGHATPTVLSGNEVWSTRLADATNYTTPPFTMLATCRPLYFDHPGRSFGEALLFKEHGGAICVVGGMREVYQQLNRTFNVAVATQFFSAAPDATLGDVFRLAHNASIPMPLGHTSEDIDNRFNTISYAMIGDPELPVSRPSLSARLTGVESLTALTPLTLTGEITDRDGNRATEFSGRVFLTLYDGRQTAKVINVNDSSDELSFLGEEVELESDQIYQAEATVANGVFTVEAFLPVPTRPAPTNRLTLFAVSADNRLVASGVLPSIAVKVPEEIADNTEATAPEITEMYLDDPTFRSGDLTSPQVTLHAAIAPNPCGIVGYSAQIGQSLSLVLDGSTRIASAPSALTTLPDGSSALHIALPTLRDGHHTLTLTVRNNASQLTSRTIAFTSVAAQSAVRLRLPRHPVAEAVEVAVEGAPAGAELCRLTVADGAGRAVFTTTTAGPLSTLELKAADGTPLPSGRYTVTAWLRAGNRYMATPAATLIVRR